MDPCLISWSNLRFSINTCDFASCPLDILQSAQDMSLGHLLQAIDTENLEQAFEILTTEGFYYSTETHNLAPLRERLFNKHLTLPSHIRFLLLSLLLVNKTPLQANEQKQCVEWLEREIKSEEYGEIAAGLLVRLSNFSNYGLVLEHLTPRGVPLGLMVDLVPKIKTKRNAALERRIMEHRTEWALLLNGYEFSLKSLSSILAEFQVLSAESNGYEMTRKLQEEVRFLKERIRCFTTQKIDLENFTEVISACIKVENKNSTQFGAIEEMFAAAGIQILNHMLQKITKKFIRKYTWLVQIASFGLRAFNSPGSVIQLLNLIANIQKILGNGALDMEEILFGSDRSLVKLLQSIILKKEVNLFNLQSNVGTQKGKIKKAELTIKQTADPFESLVKSINSHQKEQIINLILGIVVGFYSDPQEATHFPRLSDLLEQHKLPASSLKLYNSIKDIIFPKCIIYSPSIEQAYEQILSLNRLKKKRHLDINTREVTETVDSRAIRITQSRPLLSQVEGWNPRRDEVANECEHKDPGNESDLLHSSNGQSNEQLSRPMFYSFPSQTNDPLQELKSHEAVIFESKKSDDSFKSFDVMRSNVNLSKYSLNLNLNINSIPESVLESPQEKQREGEPVLLEF